MAIHGRGFPIRAHITPFSMFGSGPVVHNVTITETLTPAETSGAALVWTVAITEAASLSDSQSAQADFVAAIVESVTLTDAPAAPAGGAATGYPFDPDSTAIPYFPPVPPDRRNAQDDEQVLQVVSAAVLALF